MTTYRNSIIIELLKVYQSFADQLNISVNLSKVLHELRDIKASGNELEVAVRNILFEVLPKKYQIGQGHVIDQKLQVSKQYDLIVSDGIDSHSILKTKDGTEIYLYESIYAIGEVKVTWNRESFESTINSIKDIKSRLKREIINNKTIFSGGSEIQLSTAISSNPIRNPLFCFAFATKSDGKLHKTIDGFKERRNWIFLPNIIVVLNEGVFVLINIQELKHSKLSINLYPEFVHEDDNFEWKFISCHDSGKNFAYMLFTLIEHLSNTILERPSYLSYSSSILHIEDVQLLNLNEI